MGERFTVYETPYDAHKKIIEQQREIERLRSALEDALPCLAEHDPEVHAIAKDALHTQNGDVDTQSGDDENISVRCYNYLQRIGFDADNLGASCTLEHHWLLKDAADEIERLQDQAKGDGYVIDRQQAEIDRLRAALERARDYFNENGFCPDYIEEALRDE